MHHLDTSYTRRLPPPMPLTARLISVFSYAVAAAMVARALFFGYFFIIHPAIRFTPDVLGEFVFSVGLGLFAWVIATLAGPTERPRAQFLRHLGKACTRTFHTGNKQPKHTTNGPATFRQARIQHIFVTLNLITATLILLTVGSFETIVAITQGFSWVYPLAKHGFFLIAGLGGAIFVIALQPWWTPRTAYLRNLHHEVQNAVPLPPEAYGLSHQNVQTHA